jgi:hypothetical protein
MLARAAVQVRDDSRALIHLREARDLAPDWVRRPLRRHCALTRCSISSVTPVTLTLSVPVSFTPDRGGLLYAARLAAAVS